MNNQERPSEALRRALVRDGLMREFALMLKKARGWRMSDDAAESRVNHLLSDYGGARGLWLDDAVDAVELLGEDVVSVFFVEAAERGESAALKRRIRELEGQGERPGMAKVRHPEERRRRA